QAGIPSEGEFIQLLPGCVLSHLIDRAGAADAVLLGNRLRAFRDTEFARTSLGRELTALLQQHSAELARLAAAEPEIASRAWGVVGRVEATAASGERFDRAALDAAHDLLDEIQRLASTSLREGIERLLQLLP